MIFIHITKDEKNFADSGTEYFSNSFNFFANLHAIHGVSCKFVKTLIKSVRNLSQLVGF